MYTRHADLPINISKNITIGSNFRDRARVCESSKSAHSPPESAESFTVSCYVMVARWYSPHAIEGRMPGWVPAGVAGQQTPQAR